MFFHFQISHHFWGEQNCLKIAKSTFLRYPAQSEFASFSQRLQNLEQKGAETVSSRNSGRDSLHVAKQPVESTKASASALSSVLPGRGDRRSATLTRTEFEQQASASHTRQDTGSGSSRKRTLSQSSEDPDPDVEQGEICNLEDDSPAYSETLETIKKWLDLEVKDVECFVPPSVFSGRDQVKKSAQQSMALPPAQPLVELWRYKEFSALGSNNVDDNDPHHPPLSKGQFLSFPKPQMRFYQVSPQSFSLAAPRIQDAFNPYSAECLVAGMPLKLTILGSVTNAWYTIFNCYVILLFLKQYRHIIYQNKQNGIIFHNYIILLGYFQHEKICDHEKRKTKMLLSFS